MDIIGIDSSVVDHIISIDRIPGTDEEVSMHQQSWQGGGKVATALVAASRLGARTGIMGVVADDDYGKFIRCDMEFNKVDTSHFLCDAGKKSNYCLSLAEKKTGGRSFIAHWATHRQYSVADVDEDYVALAKAVHLYQLSDADLSVAEIAHKRGILVGFDADEYVPELEEHLDKIDIFIGSEFCFKKMFHNMTDREKNCRAILERGPKVVIFTFGSHGCIGISKDEAYFELPSFSIDAVDTTGAGDVFHGAFLYFYVCEKMSAKNAARYASAVSAVKCMYLGGRAGIPNRIMVEDFIERGSFDNRELLDREKRYSYYCVEGRGAT